MFSPDPTSRVTNVNWTSYYLILSCGGIWAFRDVVNGQINVTMAASLSVRDIDVALPALSISGSGTSLSYSAGRTYPYEMKDGDDKRILIFHSMPDEFPIDGGGGGGFLTIIIPLTEAVWWERPFEIRWTANGGSWAQLGPDGTAASGSLQQFAAGCSVTIKKKDASLKNTDEKILTYTKGQIIGEDGGQEPDTPGLIECVPIKVDGVQLPGFSFAGGQAAGPEADGMPTGIPSHYVSAQTNNSGSFIIDLKKRIVSG